MGLPETFNAILKNHLIIMVAVLLAVLAAGIFFGISFTLISLIFLLLCPLMHFFMMKDHKH